MRHEITIREIKPEEIEILEDLLYEAIFQPDPVRRLPREVIRPRIVNVGNSFWRRIGRHLLASRCV